MQKQTSIYIPKPCHEDWNKMTPTQQGKFCSACNKQVVDFSLMSDNQVLNFLSNQSGKLCGRFDAEQLQRPLLETKIKKKKSWWMALTMPLLFLFDRSEAQKFIPKQKHNAIQKVDSSYTLVGDVETVTVKDSIQSPTDSDLSPQLIGKIAISEPLIITGKIVDENNNPLAYATVAQKGTIHGITTDSAGNFSLAVNSSDKNIEIVASYVGYTSVDTIINTKDEDIADIVIKLPEYSTKGLVDVVVISKSQALTGMAGGISICRKITTHEKIDSSFRKAVGLSNVYPNPVQRGNSIHLKIKNMGNYQMQLLDNQSRLIQAEEINTGANNSTKQIQLSSNIVAGIYYLRLIDEQKKKSYTEKLIIQ